MAGHIAQQYKQVSPDKVPAEEFRSSPRRDKKGPPRLPGGPESANLPIYQSANSYSPSPFIISIMC